MEINKKKSMEICEVCEDLQEKTVGTAPTRQQYNLPTCYDHMELFSKYKQSKEFDKTVLEKKKQLLKQNENFTNFQIDFDKIDEVLKNFSIQKLADFEDKLTNNSIGSQDLKNSTDSVDTQNNDKISLKAKDSLTNISRSPITCPVFSCGQTIGTTSILSHFLRDHQKQPNIVNYQEICCNQRSILEFSTSFFEMDQVICLGVLVYSGQGTNIDDRPGQIGICKVNSFLPEKYQNLVYHLPIVILGVKTCISNLLDNDELAQQFYSPDDEEKHIYVFWLATVETTKIIHCTIAIYDQDGISSRSSIVEIRNLKDSQDPHTFLPNDTNYLMLNNGEINILTNCKKSNLFADIYVHEY